jgi:hypothetical protein
VKENGQISFESLFIMLIVLSSAMYITNLYLQTQDVTVATIIARTDLLQQINSMEQKITLGELKIIVTNNLDVFESEISVSTNPSTLTVQDFDETKLNETKNKIINATKFSNVTFKINN